MTLLATSSFAFRIQVGFFNTKSVSTVSNTESLGRVAGRKAYIGMGFADRSDSFDLNVTLQDHFKCVKKEKIFSMEAANCEAQKTNLDLAFKEGQTIRINIPNKREGGGGTKQKHHQVVGLTGIPPPPGGVPRVAPPPGHSNLTPMQSPSTDKNNADLLGDLLSDSGGGTAKTVAPTGATPKADSTSSDLWGDFESAAPTNHSSGNWVQF